MNRQHLKAFVWLRWRLALNGLRRGGNFNLVVTAALAVLMLVTSVPLFFVCLVAGWQWFPEATPATLMYVWDGMTLGFLLFWTVGLMAEVQRTDVLSPAKLLHLPLSASDIFLMNFVSSLVSVSLILFGSMMFGFGLGLPLGHGPLFLLAVPLAAGLFLMVAALTTQLQGWLAALASNPRRRRNMLVAVTAIFLVLSQLPNLLVQAGMFGFGANLKELERQQAQLEKDSRQLDEQLKSGQIDHEEYDRRQIEIIDATTAPMQNLSERRMASLEQKVRLANLILPIGWPALGVMAAAEGNPLPGLLGLAGLATIAGASLWRSYRTTIRLYQGELTAGHGRAARPTETAVPAAAASPNTRCRPMLEWRLPGISELASAVALAGLRSLIRAPEAKMMLITPVLFSAFFGTFVARLPADAPGLARPLMAIGAIALVLFAMVQLVANAFGFDRDGFRVFVLCSAPRREILLGKNLSFAPLALLLVAIPLVVLQFLRPLGIEHLLSLAPQFISMYLLFCLMANLMSIYAPLPIAIGSLKPTKQKLSTVLVQLVFFLVLFPLTQSATLLPLGLEYLLSERAWAAPLPLCLLATLVECPLVILLYRWLLAWQGNLLAKREQTILETVTGRTI